MNRKIVAIFLLSMWVQSTALRAQEIWSLEKCVNYALTNNIKIKQGVIATQYQQNQLQQSKFSRLPNLNGQTSQNLNYGRSLTYENTYKDIFFYIKCTKEFYEKQNLN